MRRASEKLDKGLLSGFLSLRVLGGSWVVISGVISPLIWVITIVTPPPLITPLITTQEPPSRGGVLTVVP